MKRIYDLRWWKRSFVWLVMLAMLLSFFPLAPAAATEPEAGSVSAVSILAYTNVSSDATSVEDPTVLTVNDTFAVWVTVDGAQNLQGADLQLEFNHAVLQVEHVDFLGNDVPVLVPGPIKDVPADAGTVDNTAGSVTYAAANKAAADYPEGTALLKIGFTIIAEGEAFVSFKADSPKLTDGAAGIIDLTGIPVTSLQFWIGEEVVAPVPVDGVTLDRTELTLAVGGDAVTLVATVLPVNATNKDVTWSTSDASIATVDEDGKVEATGAGVATITVTTVDGGRTATSEVTVTVPAVPVTGVTLTPAAIELVVGETTTLAAIVLPADATNKDVTWSSSTPAAVTVDAGGMITSVAVGTSIITVTTVDGGHIATCEVTVTEAVVLVTGVTLTPAAIGLVVGEATTLAAIVLPVNATNKDVTWSTSDASIATVDEDGKVEATGAGVATITVTTVDGGRTATSEVTVTVPAVPVTGVTLTPAAIELVVGETTTLAAIVLPADATNKDVTWSSSTPAAVTVDAGGVITSVAVGTSIITVTTVDGGHTATSVVTVVPFEIEFISPLVFSLGMDARVGVRATNRSDQLQDILLIVALFDEHETMLNHSFSAQLVDPGGTVLLGAGFKLPDMGVYKVRAFVWDSWDDISPLSEVLEIAVKGGE